MRFRQRDIVQVVVTPTRGKPKRRPAMIYTPTPQIPGAAVIDVVGISTSHRPGDPDCIPLPWRADGNVPRRLRRDSALCLDLLDHVGPDELEPVPGAYLPETSPAFVELLKRLKALGQL